MPTLIALRKRIEKIDATIIHQLALRQKLAQKIGQLKLQAGKKITDSAREKRLAKHHEKCCRQEQISMVYIKQLFRLIIRYSRKLQK